MEPTQISSEWPNALRWFLCQELVKLTPWHFIQKPGEFQFAANAFRLEDIRSRDVFVFARRQDCDDFAGLEIKDGSITNNVLHFHPVFSSSTISGIAKRDWDIVCGTFEDVFEFVSKRVVPDMKEWAMTEDASDL